MRCFLGTTNSEPVYAGCQLKDFDMILPIDPAAPVKQPSYLVPVKGAVRQSTIFMELFDRWWEFADKFML